MGAVELVLVRHGESAGNVAAAVAQRTGAEVIDIGLRDADVLIRYVCEQLTEDELLEIATTTTVMNASATQLIRPAGTGIWQLGSVGVLAERRAPAACRVWIADGRRL